MKKLVNIVLLLVPLNLFGAWVLQQSGVSNNLGDVYFVDANHGWIAAGSDSGKGLILRTTDGGANWEKVHTDSGTIFCVGFFDSLEGWAGGQGPTYYDFLDVWSLAVLFHTTDGGQIWNKSKNINSDKFRASTSLWEHTFTWIHRIHIVNSTYGFYMLGGYHMDNGTFGSWVGVSSLDGVHHWRDGHYQNLTADIIGVDLCFIDSLCGWVLEVLKTLYTEKGIESLAVISSPFYSSVGSIDFTDSLHGWVVPNTNVVYLTVDGGNSWTAETIAVAENLYVVDFLYSLNGWIAGNISSIGIILRTRDGGNTWLRESTPITYPIRSLCFVDTLQGWAVGDRGKILHYTTVGVEEDRSQMPEDRRQKLEVEPNLCSSVVRIKYSVDKEKDVSLNIYDVTGRLIEVLVDSKIDQGHYELEWTATGLPRGIYFATLVTPDHKTTKKLILTL